MPTPSHAPARPLDALRDDIVARFRDLASQMRAFDMLVGAVIEVPPHEVLGCAFQIAWWQRESMTGSASWDFFVVDGAPDSILQPTADSDLVVELSVDDLVRAAAVVDDLVARVAVSVAEVRAIRAETLAAFEAAFARVQAFGLPADE